MNFLKLIALAFVIVFHSYSNCQESEKSALYFNQTPPSTTPKKFAPGIISKPDRYEFGCAFSKDGKEFFFGESNGNNNIIYQSVLKNGKWSEPQNIFPGDIFSNNDPMLSVDEKRLYFISDRPLEGSSNQKDIDIWYTNRLTDGWSEPVNASAPINSNLEEYFISFSRSGTMYFASNSLNNEESDFDIYSSEQINGVFQKRKRLPPEINTRAYEADVFVAPDESYLIFCANRKGGLGRGDLYISFKDKGGKWTKSISMGSPINTEGHELCPFVTADGKYFFYTSNEDIYWVSTEIFDSYRK